MKKNYFSCLFLIILGVLPASLLGQKIVKTRGESGPVRIESNMTEQDARQIALEKAKIDAIEDVFGAYVEQETDITIEDGKTSFHIIGGTKVKGYWIETFNGFPKYTERTETVKSDYEDGFVNWIECVIEGKAKEVTPLAQIDYEILNLPDVLGRTDEFESGESFYLFFKSPVDGYLSVFLEAGETVYRLLPYSEMDIENRSAVRIKEDMEYVFFSGDREHDYFKDSRVDEYELFTYLEMEYNYVHIVFSTESYKKPLLDHEQDVFEYKDKYLLPKSCDKQDFEKWLAGNRATMDSFQEIRKKIRIVK